MNGSTPHTTVRRWLNRLGYGLVQAAIVGAVFGALAYFRTERLHDDEDASPVSLHRLRDHFESLELATYDWRARALGEASQPSDDVVVVAIDDMTLANARQNPHPGVALQPWPREFVGGLAAELVNEGAKSVVLDSLYPDLSPRACPGVLPGTPAGPEDEVMELGDDWRFRSRLDALADRTVLAFSWSEGRGPRAEVRLTPFGLRIAAASSIEEALPVVRRILSDRRKLFLVPAGQQLELWAGADSAAEGTELARALALEGTPQIRALTPADLDRPFGAQDLLVRLAELHVDGLDPEELPLVADVESPVPALLSDASRYGATSAQPGVDGVVRAAQHLVGYRARRDGQIHVLPSAALAAAMQVAGTRSLRYRAGRLEVGDKFSFPMDPTGATLIRWDAGAQRGPGGTTKRAVPAWNVVKNVLDEVVGQPHQFDNALGGKIAVLSNTSSASPDVLHTPVGRRTPGAAVLAQSLANILHSDGIQRAAPSLDFLLTFGTAFLGALLAMAFSRSRSGTSGVALHAFGFAMAVGIYLFAARQTFLNHHLWIAVAAPLLSFGTSFGLSAAHGVRTEREVRDFVRLALGRPVPPDIVRRVSRDVALLRPERRQATLLVVQLEGLGALSDELPAESLAELASQVYTEVRELIQRSDGHLDAHAAEGLIAIWGAPLRTQRHAQAACEVALEIRDALGARAEEWRRRFGHAPRCRIGVDTGEVLVGNMGSPENPSYRAFGRPVGSAPRLSHANEVLGTAVLVGERTVQIAAPELAFREVDQLRVPGQPEPVRVFELMGRPDALGPGRVRQLEPFARALEAYRNQRFLEALELFEQCRALNDPAAAVYVERCRVYFSTPPPANWDGVFAVQSMPGGSGPTALES